MSAFFRFPHTPHLMWLGPGHPRDDKVLGAQEVALLLATNVLVEEKIDGANLGISIGETGAVRVQNRGSYLAHDSCHPQFKPLFRWLEPRRDALVEALYPNLMLFGEWCWAVHTVRYTALPDWFLAFDVYDAAFEQFWSVRRRDELVARLGIALVPQVARGRFDLAGLLRLVGTSCLGDTPAEGLYIRRDDGDHLLARAKLVRAEFTQAIDQHWSKRRLESNQLARGVAWP